MVPFAAPLDALTDHLRLFSEALVFGDGMIQRQREDRTITAHAYLAHQARMADADLLRHGMWGHRGVLTAYTRIGTLTPVVDLGLGGHGVAARLRDRGISSPHAVWRQPFLAMGVDPSAPPKT